jgi:hypothetical protein
MPEGAPGSGTAGSERPGELSQSGRIQILATEHWSLLATRSLSWSEAFSRASMFLSALSGTVVALALAGQTMSGGQGFILFALLLLPVTLFVGLTTFARLVAINNEDTHWVMGMNRLRRAYMDLAPDLERYFSSGTYDDPVSVMQTFAATPGPGTFLHGFVTTPGMIGVIDAVIAGVLGGLVAGVVGAELAYAVIVGAVVFVIAVAALAIYQFRVQMRFVATNQPRFPRP